MYNNLLKKRLQKIKECTADSVVSGNSNVRFICDIEGNVLYVDKILTNLNDKHYRFAGNSLLEIVHPEDLNVLIEKMVDLIQEKGQSVLIEPRLLNRNGQTLYSKLYMSYLRGLFYFYPLN
jgi:hypothetical protein